LIKVENLTKEYVIRHQTASSYTALRDVIAEKAKGIFKPSSRETKEKFRALNDISFEVQQGDRVGIIGRNGAGKSTLLKVLSRIVSPTHGRITIEGRVASLLEVGTGFHPELSGRENIFLNGAILGMSKQEIKSKFDEIVEFSEVERFLDTPVKRYSSGMYVRLAFSVAAHLEPEILIVDEVLAVGDAQFQKKCLGKMEDISKGGGRTILFVSHNMASLTNLCNKGMVLHKGSVSKNICDIQEAVNYYVQLSSQQQIADLANRNDRQGEGDIKFTSLSVLNAENKNIDVIITGEKVRLKLGYECFRELREVSVAIAIYGLDGSLYTMLGNEYSAKPFNALDGKGHFICELDKFPLTSGKYALNISVNSAGTLQDWVQDAAHIDVEDGDFYGTGRIVPSSHRSIMIDNKWSLNN
jgi:lipopolysaccharide transport system ATP-binding protein